MQHRSAALFTQDDHGKLARFCPSGLIFGLFWFSAGFGTCIAGVFVLALVDHVVKHSK